MLLDYKKITSFYRLFKKGYGEYKARLFLMGLLSFVSSVMEGVGLTVLVPLLSFTSKEGAANEGIVYRILSSVFKSLGATLSIKNLLIVICAIFFVKAIFQFYSGYINTRILNSFELNNKKKLFRLTMGSDWAYLSKQKLGHLAQSITTDVDSSSKLFSLLSSVIIALINLAVYTFLIFKISMPVALLLVVLIIVSFFFLKPLFYKSRVLATQMSVWYKSLSHFVDQAVLGMKSIKSMAVENKLIKTADKYFEDYRRLSFKIALFENFVNSISQPVGMLFVVAIFVFLYKYVGFNYGSFTVIIYAVYKAFVHLQNTQLLIQRMNTFVPFLASLLKYSEQTEMSREEGRGTKSFQYKKSLQFQNVEFSYEEGRMVLHEVNMVFPKGEVVGIYGPSGSGKTTVVDLILRLYREQKGKILLDEEEISNIDLAAWRNSIGYVSQDLFLINDTVENNIKFFRDDISKEDMVDAARMANIDDFIESLPAKYNSVIGERGILLSNGQRQRIVLARILAKKPEIIILDEATSALDNETEIFVQKAIESLKRKLTVIVIAHRLTTIMNADRVYALKDGEIIENGSPTELLASNKSYFYKMFNIVK